MASERGKEVEQSSVVTTEGRKDGRKGALKMIER